MMKRYLPFLLCCAACLSSARAADEAGLIKTLRGVAVIERGGKTVEPQVGDRVFEGDRVAVRGNGSVGISLRDETLISIGPNSAMKIDSFAYNPVTRNGRVETSMLKGTLRYVTGLIGRLNPEAIKVTTPTATVGIRGTEFIVEVPFDEK